MAVRRHRPGANKDLTRARPALLLALLAVAVTCRAGEWTLEPGLRLSETWTDNFSRSSQDPEEEWITEIAPTMRLQGEGRRAQLDLVYRLQQLLHAQESGRDRTNHRLNADGSVEFVRERLFFDADATHALGSAGPDLFARGSDVVATDERRTVTTWSAGPQLQYPLGRFARLRAEARRSHVDFGSEAEGESDSDTADIGLASGPVFTRWGWAVDYNRREESRDRDEGVGEDTRFERLRGELSLRAGPATQLFVAGGTEDNEFLTAEAGDPVDGDFWEAGFRWHPRRNVSLEAAAGERFFGDTARASLRLRGSTLSLELDVSEDLVTTPQLQFERSTALLRDADGNLVVGPDGDPVTVAIDVPTVRDDVVLQQRAGARLGWERGHSAISLSLLGTDREFQREGSTEQSRQGDLEWRWSRLPRTTLTAGLGLREQEFAGRAREDELTTVRLEARRKLAADAELQVRYQHEDRDSNEAGDKFESNVVTVALNLTF